MYIYMYINYIYIYIYYIHIYVSSHIYTSINIYTHVFMSWQGLTPVPGRVRSRPIRRKQRTKIAASGAQGAAARARRCLLIGEPG